jgi:polyhydroxyalkanoate synthase
LPAASYKIILRNSAMELRHYAGHDAGRQPIPILLVPSWSHGVEALDLSPQHSLIAWLTAQGFDLYLISWQAQAPDRDLADAATLGPQAALARILSLTGAKQVHGAGIGLGGTLLAATQAKMQAAGQSGWSSASYFASLLDFSDPGELSVFIAEEQLRRLDDSEAAGAPHALVDLLRANDLIWSYVLDCFLGERDPLPLPLLRWNSDSLTIPLGLQHWHLRDLYQSNLLARRNALSIDKIGLDLGAIALPTYLLAMGQDHLAPWRSVYQGGRLLGGTPRFVRAEGGHITGLLNPPSRYRLGYWTTESAGLPEDAQQWQRGARFQPGSWWRDWSDWLKSWG